MTDVIVSEVRDVLQVPDVLSPSTESLLGGPKRSFEPRRYRTGTVLAPYESGTENFGLRLLDEIDSI